MIFFLLGALEHEFSFNIGNNLVTPTDELICFKMVIAPPTRILGAIISTPQCVLLVKSTTKWESLQKQQDIFIKFLDLKYIKYD